MSISAIILKQFEEHRRLKNELKWTTEALTIEREAKRELAKLVLSNNREAVRKSKFVLRGEG